MASSGRLTATAREFTPASKMFGKVLDSTFISQTLPDIPTSAGIVGLCAVPQDRAGADDLGWHIADFLAFKSLLCGQNAPKAQTWLAQCDVARLVKDHPEYYVHGKERRVVGGAAEASTYLKDGKLLDREDNIQVESLEEQLRATFIEAIQEKLNVTKRFGYPLIIIFCGLTSVEQDIFFTRTHGGSRLTSKEIRQIIGDDVDVTFITPALFSAGWQINPSFCSSEAGNVRANRTQFLARQFGGIFAQNIVGKFIGWECPILDSSQLDPGMRAHERFPGPAMPTEKQQSFIDTLKVNIHSCLAGRCSLHYQDHSFHFDKESDDWERLISPRKGKPLEVYKKKWESLETLPSSGHGHEMALPFLGNVFGGTRSSQISHIKHLIQESFGAWPGYWALDFGQKAMAEFVQFVNTIKPDELTCHEFFNILEHRASLNVLADMVVRSLDMPLPNNVRCRDWNHLGQPTQPPEKQRLLLNLFQEFTTTLPSPNIPPGRNPNRYSRIQTRLDIPIFYLIASLGNGFAFAPGKMQAAAKEINNLFTAVQVQQAKMLTENPKIREMCVDWLQSINMPVRFQDPNIDWQEFAAVKVVPTIDDEQNEYEVVVAERSSPQEIAQTENVQPDGNSSARHNLGGFQHAPAVSNTHQGPPAVYSPGINVNNDAEQQSASSPLAYICDDIKLLHGEKKDLVERLTSIDDENDQLRTVKRLKDVKKQIEELEKRKEKIERGEDPQSSKGKPSNMGSQATSNKIPREEETAPKMVPERYSESQAENRPLPSLRMAPHETREMTKGFEDLKVQGEMRPQTTTKASLYQNIEGSPPSQHGDMGKRVINQSPTTEERTRQPIVPERQRDAARPAFDYSKVVW
ncbi:hypothetical protein F4810DRAFT_721821 [Camillea tinctor]|nr:hypothetical protein F4810DRAFT_721821 [Camillea tinctor]